MYHAIYLKHFYKVKHSISNLKPSDKRVALTPLCKYHKMYVTTSQTQKSLGKTQLNQLHYILCMLIEQFDIIRFIT